MQDRTDVRKLALSYADRRYSLAVLVHELSEEQVTKTYTQLQGIAQSYPRFRPIIYVLGPNQAHSILLNDDGIQLFNEQ